MLLFVRHDLLFSGAKDYFCVTVFVCLHGQDYGTRERGEGYCSFSSSETPSEAGNESTVFFAHLLADCANFTGPVKGRTVQSNVVECFKGTNHS